MANPSTSKNNDKAKNATPPPAAKPADAPKATTTDAAPAADKPKKVKRAKMRYVSTSIDGYFVRTYSDLVAKHGVPKDPTGADMVARAATPGLSAEAKAAKETAKAAEKAKLDAMSPEEKLEYAKAKRDAKAAKKAAKKQKEREALIAQLKAELVAGKL